MKTLILVPKLTVLGGISLHYIGLKDYWTENVEYFEGFRLIKKNIIASVIICIFKYISFILKALTYRPDNLVLNVSLKKGFFSEVYYVRVAKLFNINIFKYIHGWDVNSEWMLRHKKGRFLLENSNKIIVLSSLFKEKLENNGYADKSIYVTCTKVDDKLVAGFDINTRKGEIKKFLYLSRIEKGKGLEMSLDIFKLINREYPDTTYTIAGDGNHMEYIKCYIKENNINNVELVGKVSGKDVANLFSRSDFFFLLSESEGMPAALLEALAFGLPVATTPVGGIPEIFKDETMGILSYERNSEYYYKRINELISDKEKTKEISIYNYNFAKEHFYASKVARQMEEIFN